MVDQGLPQLVASLKSRISMYTVDRLKGIIQGFNEHCGSNLNRTGKKSELQEKLKAQLDQWEATNSTVSIANAKKVLDHIDTNGTQSPFFEVEQHVSAVTPCPESLHMQDRKTIYFDFSLTAEQREKLSATGTAYQLRLYCTSSTFYTAPTAFRPSPVNNPCPMEFPNTCEIRVNNTNLHAQTKGLKKKPGTAPPANLGPSVRMGANNKVEMLYCNQNPVQGQPPNNRKYFVQVNLVKATTPDQLVQILRKGKYRSKEEILMKMRQNVDDDDEIEAGPQKLSLKCPLSYTRIEVPIRSSACPHPACFDADSWYSMMEVTTTWQCPICEKTLNLDEMIVDGYFDNILKTTDEDVEDVIVESNGEWHTQDGKYHSSGWVRPATDPAATRVASTSTSSSITMRSPESIPTLANGYDKGHVNSVPHVQPRRTSSFHTAAEEIVLDSDEDEAGAPVIPSATALRPPLTQERSTGGGGGDDVIDLTLSDSEDEAPLAATVGKRKERSPTDGSTAASDSSKRMRYEPPPPPGAWRDTGGGSSTGSGYRSWAPSNGTAASTPNGYSGASSASSSTYGMRSSSSTYPPPPPSASANSLSFLPSVHRPPSNSYGGPSAYNVSPPSNALPSPSINSSSPNVNSPPLPAPPGNYRPDNGAIILPPLHFNANSNPRLPALSSPLPNTPISPRTFPPPHRPPGPAWRAPPSPERDIYPRQNERW
ncbi:SUMO ligase siz1 [Tulasnella sp. 417]|nr:SUMO ligase siz1 [Tulasnella sp. 417]